MGGRGSGLSKSSKIAGLNIELDYAVQMKHKYGTVKFGGTKETRNKFEMWSNEVRRLQKELSKYNN